MAEQQDWLADIIDIPLDKVGTAVDPDAVKVGETVKVSNDIVIVSGMEFNLKKRYIVEVDEVENMPNFQIVGINGEVHQIRRGAPVSVKAPVAIGLCRAIASRLVKVSEVNGKPEYELRDYHAVPFRILGEDKTS